MAKKVKSTLYIAEDKREKIRCSGLSLEEYINRMYEMYEKFCLDKWNDGYFRIKYFRVCFLRAETLNLILDHLEDETLLEIGREVGEKLRLTVEDSFKHRVHSMKESEMIEDHLKYLNDFRGWGCFTLENEMIIITMPIFTKPYLIQGYLEGILNHKLTVIEAYPNRMSFKINNYSNPST